MFERKAAVFLSYLSIVAGFLSAIVFVRWFFLP